MTTGAMKEGRLCSSLRQGFPAMYFRAAAGGLTASSRGKWPSCSRQLMRHATSAGQTHTIFATRAGDVTSCQSRDAPWTCIPHGLTIVSGEGISQPLINTFVYGLSNSEGGLENLSDCGASP